jgi:8-oxo-dGTP pyrophosphatase MutT (NUDIX family)
MKLQQHRVQVDDVATTHVIDDWLWIDYHDRINVLIEAPKANTGGGADEPHFIVIEQTKYALEDRTSLAIVGGIIEPGEDPKNAAVREVWEETGYKCDKFDFLGRYRTDVNRGMGWTNTYVARMCTRQEQSTRTNSNGKAVLVDEVGKADEEKQTIIHMSLTEIREAVMDARFLEIQWSATVALALLLYDKKSGNNLEDRATLITYNRFGLMHVQIVR